MKFTITMKDPDGFYDSLQSAAEEDLKESDPTIDEEEREMVLEHRTEKLKELLKTWFRYDEYLTVEIDTVKKTCTVVNAK